MSTIIFEKNDSYVLASPVDGLLEDEAETASDWASRYIVRNPAIRWITGKYVEADRANNNGQYWELEALQMAKASLAYAPLNINHRQDKLVGTIVAGEMIYPPKAPGSRPYIETVSAFWFYQNRVAFEEVQAAFRKGSLFESMECVSRTVTCMDETCGRDFAYMGPRDESYCDHLQEGGVRRFNEPHFVGGALIVPPVRPGWSGAEVREIASLLGVKFEEYADKTLESVKEASPHLSESEWESAMLAVLSAAVKPVDQPSPYAIARSVVARMR